MAAITRKPFTFKPDGDAEAQKAGMMEVDWTGCPVEAIRMMAMKDIIIRWQGRNRKKFTDFKPGNVVKVNGVDFAPGDPMACLNAMSKDERIAYFKANDWL